MAQNLHTSGELLDIMTSEFERRNMEQAQAEAVAIIAELRSCNRLQARIERDVVLSDAVFSRGMEILRRRLADEPWQYIFNRAYFRDLELFVAPGVLIPRPETELLAEWCIDFLPEHGSLLDLGTGSGAIALAVATERADVQVTACDVSCDALAIAAENIKNIAPGKVELLHSDLFSALGDRKFDIIAANLPYVTEDEYNTLTPEVKLFEPEIALVSGKDGLDCIRHAIEQIPDHLNSRGAVILEMSEHQTGKTAEIFSSSHQYCAIEIIKDYTHRNRFVAARKVDKMQNC